MTTEVDLLDSSGVIISIAAADDTFWNSNAAWVTYLAAQKGFGIYVPGGAPAPGTAERNIASIADAQNWFASAQLGLVRPKATSSTSKWLVGGLVASALLAIGALVVATRPQ